MPEPDRTVTLLLTAARAGNRQARAGTHSTHLSSANDCKTGSSFFRAEKLATGTNFAEFFELAL